MPRAHLAQTLKQPRHLVLDPFAKLGAALGGQILGGLQHIQQRTNGGRRSAHPFQQPVEQMILLRMRA